MNKAEEKLLRRYLRKLMYELPPEKTPREEDMEFLEEQHKYIEAFARD